MFDAYALCAKCRAIRSRMLTRADYAVLAACTDLPSVLETLSRMGDYGALFEDTALHRADAEHLLRRGYYALYEKLLRFTAGAPRRYFDRLIERLQIIYLSRAAQSLYGGVCPRYSALPSYLQKLREPDFSAVCRAGSAEALIVALAGTKYYKLALVHLTQAPDAARFEDALYCAYYDMLYHEACAQLDAASADAVRALISARSDAINAERAVRMVRYGFAREEDTFLSTGTPAGDARVRAILSGKVPPETENAAQVIYDRCNRILSSGAQDMSVPTALLLIAETELNNLTYVIEGIRYGVGADAIMEKMICR